MILLYRKIVTFQRLVRLIKQKEAKVVFPPIINTYRVIEAAPTIGFLTIQLTNDSE